MTAGTIPEHGTTQFASGTFGNASEMLTIEPPVFPQVGTITQEQLNSMTRALWGYVRRDIINNEITLAMRGAPPPFATGLGNGGAGGAGGAGIAPGRFASGTASVAQTIRNVLKNHGKAMRVKHLPTGMTVRCQTERSQQQNKAYAIQLLRSRLVKARDDKAFQDQAQDRRAQIGSGERSDKIRTVQVKNNIVVNHLTGKKMRLKDYLRGEIEKVA